ncbi:MAG: creatininase family protein [Rhodospirillaceae bacterium]|nr:creatininase family protein [Rhodospirillaceae bacterium]
MRIRDMNWMQVEAYLERDDRAVIPLGSTEQHAQLSLTVDCILSERVATDAAEPLGVPVFPPVNYGITPYFKSYPGTISMRPETLIAVFRDVFDSLKRAGFRRIMVVNGHGGNAPVASLAQDWMSENEGVTVRFHNWYNAPETWKKVQEIDPAASHASWMENFPWTRLANAAAPEGAKDMVDIPRMMLMGPAEIRSYIGDGNMGGVYEKPDEVMMALWQTAVEETRALLDGPWA